MRIALRRQFGLGVTAQVYAQAVTIGSQLLVLPLMLILWGAERYGAWLIVSALPTYLAMADLGFAQIAANDMTMRWAKDDRRGAIVVNRTAWFMVGGVSIVLLALSAAFVWLVPIADLFRISATDAADVPLATFLLAVSTSLSILFGVVGAAMRSQGHFPVVVAVNATSRFLDGAIVVAAGLGGLGFASLAALLVAAKMLVLGLGAAVFYHRHVEFRPSIAGADLTLMRRMLAPSLSYVSYSVSYALNIQGTALVVGYLLGPPAVVVVSAIRTFTRLGRVAASVFINAIEPVFAQLAGRAEHAEGAKAIRYLVWASIAGTAIYVTGMLVMGEWFLGIWTHGVVVDQTELFVLMLLGVSFEIIWVTVQTPYVATNQHSAFAMWFLLASVVSFALQWPAIATNGINATGYFTVALNLAMLVLTIVVARSHKAVP